MQHGGDLVLEPGMRYIIDVGSVGQPRDLNPKPSLAFYDPEAARVQWVRYEYPVEAVAQKMREAKLPAYLADRLAVGR
jgi:hypothetical protein